MHEQVQEYNLKIAFDYSFLKEANEFSDCVIVVEGEEFPCHRIILSGLSPVFRRHFIGTNNTRLELPNITRKGFRSFLDFVYTSCLSLSIENLPEILRIGYDYEIKTLFDACCEFADTSSSARTILHLLETLSFALTKLPNLIKFAASLVEVLSNDTDFSFLSTDAFKLLLSRARFTSNYARDDIIKKYLESTGEDPSKFSDFAESLAGAVDDTIQRTAFSAVFICSPPDPGLLHSMNSQIVVTSSGQLNGRDPRSIIEDNPIRHWFTESDGNAWVLIEFTELYIQPTDYGIWSHGGASTLRNWCFQGSNDRQSWVILSNHRDDETIRDPFSSGEWPINTNGFFKYFRILQTGNNWAGNRWLYLMKVEIWGVACQMDPSAQVDDE